MFRKPTFALYLPALLVKQLLSFCLFCCFLPDAPAQNVLPAAHQPSPKFIHFTTAEGLPSNFEIYSMTTDAEGFLWVGTKEGLARFDGRRFMSFNEMQPRHPLPEEPVQYVFADRQGRLWVGIGNEGIYSIDLVTFQTRFFKVPFWENDPSPTTYRTVEDTDGNLWFCSPEGIVLLERGSERFSFFPLRRDGAPKQLVRDLCLGQTGEIWVATRQGLFRFDTRKRQYEQQPTGGVRKKIIRIGCDHEGLVWMSSWYNLMDGFTVFDPRLGKIIRTFSQNPNDPAMPANTDAWNIYPVGDTIWFATNAGGLCAFDKKQDRFFSYLPELGNPASIASSQVIGIHLDQSGNLWTSARHQLSQLPAYRKTTELLTHKPGVASSLIGSLFETVEALPDGLMAIGAEGGMNLYDPVAHRTANFTLPNYNGNVANNSVLSFANADAQTVWVGTWSGLHRMDKRTGQLLVRFVTAGNAGENHPLSVKRMRVGAISRLLLDRHGVLWVINDEQYLRRLKKGTDFEYLDTLHTHIGPLIAGIYCLLEQDEQRVFLGSDNGLLQFNQQEGSFQAVPLQFSGEQGRLKVADMAWSKNGDLLAIVNDKIWRIDLHTYTARRIAPTTPMRNCLGVIEDQIGNIWICTEHGLTQISPGEKRSRTLDAKNFLHGNTFTFGIYNFKVAAQDADGRLYFAGTKGVTMLRPKDWTFEDEMLEAKIISLKINNLLADLDTVIHKKNKLQLPYGQNNLTFQFAVPDATMPQIARFAYRLKQDEEWVDIGTQNTINLSSLSPGNYVLEVRAASYDGLWSEKTARLYFTILPPWWRSWWAFVLYTLTVLGATYWFYQMQLRL